eukprot:3851689-Amphidinium_carterae.1
MHEVLFSSKANLAFPCSEAFLLRALLSRLFHVALSQVVLKVLVMNERGNHPSCAEGCAPQGEAASCRAGKGKGRARASRWKRENMAETLERAREGQGQADGRERESTSRVSISDEREPDGSHLGRRAGASRRTRMGLAVRPGQAGVKARNGWQRCGIPEKHSLWRTLDGVLLDGAGRHVRGTWRITCEQLLPASKVLAEIQHYPNVKTPNSSSCGINITKREHKALKQR